MSPVPRQPAVEVQRSPEKRARENVSESVETPSDSDEPMCHSSGTLMSPPPKSGLGADHPCAEKVVNASEVQLVKPRAPHPISNEHVMSCLSLVNELEHLQQSNDPKINSNITGSGISLPYLYPVPCSDPKKPILGRTKDYSISKLAMMMKPI